MCQQINKKCFNSARRKGVVETGKIYLQLNRWWEVKGQVSWRDWNSIETSQSLTLRSASLLNWVHLFAKVLLEQSGRWNIVMNITSMPGFKLISKLTNPTPCLQLSDPKHLIIVEHLPLTMNWWTFTIRNNFFVVSTHRKSKLNKCASLLMPYNEASALRSAEKRVLLQLNVLFMRKKCDKANSLQSRKNAGKVAGWLTSWWTLC